jgi:hypothetical protein
MGEDETSTRGGFFQSNMSFYLKYSLSKLKKAQQDLIDQARWNLAQPIKFYFSGVLQKYYAKVHASLDHIDVNSLVMEA